MQYKNTSNNDLTIIGVGEVKAGATFESPEKIENPNIQMVSSTPAPAVAPATAPAEAPKVAAEPANPQ